MKTDNQKGWDKLKEAERIKFIGHRVRSQGDLSQREKILVRHAFDCAWNARHSHATRETFETRDLPPPTIEEQTIDAQAIWEELNEIERDALRHWAKAPSAAGWSITGTTPDHVLRLVVLEILWATPEALRTNRIWYTLSPTGEAVAKYDKEQE